MAKYISKKLSDYWWNTSEAKQKGFTDQERKAALYYEFSARDLSADGSVHYAWGKRWIDLPDFLRNMVVSIVWPFMVPRAVRIDDFPEIDTSLFNSEELQQVWSITFPLQFNLMASKTAVCAKVGQLFEHLQEKRGLAGSVLERRKRRPLSFRPVELLSRKIRGERLSKMDREVLRLFRTEHQKEIDAGMVFILRLRLAAAAIEAQQAAKSKHRSSSRSR